MCCSIRSRGGGVGEGGLVEYWLHKITMKCCKILSFEPESKRTKPERTTTTGVKETQTTTNEESRWTEKSSLNIFSSYLPTQQINGTRKKKLNINKYIPDIIQIPFPVFVCKGRWKKAIVKIQKQLRNAMEFYAPSQNLLCLLMWRMQTPLY